MAKLQPCQEFRRTERQTDGQEQMYMSPIQCVGPIQQQQQQQTRTKTSTKLCN